MRRVSMGLFDFFKGDEAEETRTDRYWTLATIDGEIEDPTMEQIQQAVENATQKETLFATLAFLNSGLEIKSIQAISDQGLYRFEALTSTGTMYVKNDIPYEETLELFEQFFKYQRVPGYKSWLVEKY